MFSGLKANDYSAAALCDLGCLKMVKCWLDNGSASSKNSQSISWSTAQEKQTIGTHSAMTNGGPNVKSRNAASVNTMKKKTEGMHTWKPPPPRGQKAKLSWPFSLLYMQAPMCDPDHVVTINSSFFKQKCQIFDVSRFLKVRIYCFSWS